MSYRLSFELPAFKRDAREPHRLLSVMLGALVAIDRRYLARTPCPTA